MKFPAKLVLFFLLTISAFASEKKIELRLLRTDLRIEFKGLTQAGEKNQSLEIRELYHSETKPTELKADTTCFYIVFDPDTETSFWAPEVLRTIVGFNPLLKQLTTDTYQLYYMVGNSGLRRETWKLSREKRPLLEKTENLERSEYPSRQKP